MPTGDKIPLHGREENVKKTNRQSASAIYMKKSWPGDPGHATPNKETLNLVQEVGPPWGKGHSVV